MPAFDVSEHIVIDPEIMHGRMTFRGTRVPVSMVLAALTRDEALDTIESKWPHIPREAVREAVRLACEALHQRYALELDAADDEARKIWDASFGATSVEEKATARSKREAELAAEFASS